MAMWRGENIEGAKFLSPPVAAGESRL